MGNIRTEVETMELVVHNRLYLNKIMRLGEMVEAVEQKMERGQWYRNRDVTRGPANKYAKL